MNCILTLKDRNNGMLCRSFDCKPCNDFRTKNEKLKKQKHIYSYVDKIICYCFDTGNVGLQVTHSFSKPLEVIDESDLEILKLLKENNISISIDRVYILEAFDSKNGREKYELELLDYLQEIYHEGTPEEDLFEPSFESYRLLVTQYLLDKLNESESKK